MAEILLRGESFEIDDNGYLIDWRVWNKKIAIYLAKEDGVELTEPHWKVINMYRKLFEENGKIPQIQLLVNRLSKEHGWYYQEVKRIYELFSAGLAVQACRYAGLPKPTCSNSV